MSDSARLKVLTINKMYEWLLWWPKPIKLVLQVFNCQTSFTSTIQRSHTSWQKFTTFIYHHSSSPPKKNNRIIIIIIIIINPLTARVFGAPQMILQPVFSIFPCSPLPSGTCRTPGLSIPWCCLPASSSVCLVFFPLSLCLATWFWPDLMNGKHYHTTAVCVSLR